MVILKRESPCHGSGSARSNDSCLPERRIQSARSKLARQVHERWRVFSELAKKNQPVRFFTNKQMYRSRVSQIDMGSFIVVTFPDCLFSSQFSLLDGFRSLF